MTSVQRGAAGGCCWGCGCCRGSGGGGFHVTGVSSAFPLPGSVCACVVERPRAAAAAAAASQAPGPTRHCRCGLAVRPRLAPGPGPAPPRAPRSRPRGSDGPAPEPGAYGWSPKPQLTRVEGSKASPKMVEKDREPLPRILKPRWCFVILVMVANK
ncbi:protein FAM117B-like [Artibeus jamaicensis]|uniref:protein FAM117B-like n=1 Tax=Artibeus jamaicensis TaxID=9417 RepID=UPI00235A6873|nr:protein FAM117B-like [Artibeus jamaicensis]